VSATGNTTDHRASPSALGREEVEWLWSDDYLQADYRFRRACALAGADTVSFEHPLKGPGGETLRLSACRIGASQPRHVVLVTSGTHGVEGYAGSAIQTGILNQIDGYRLRSDLAIVMVHAINPWGLAWDRRENEDNVDLFRNFIYCDPPYANNPLYDQLDFAINPAEWIGPERERAERAIAEYIAAHGEDAFVSIVRRGQHDHPNGLTYHGRGPSWSKTRVDEIARRYICPGARVANLEIHTSWGKLDECLAISYAPEGSTKLARIHRWLTEMVYLPGADPLIPMHPFTPFEYLEKLIPGVEVTAVVLECGTYDCGMSLDCDRHSNYVFTRGDPMSSQGLQARQTMRRYCYPDSIEWKIMALNRGEAIFRQMLERVHDW
jgi:hypothetical protein